MTLYPENVQSYPRPPALEPADHRIRITLGGRAIVDTTRAFRVLETHHAPTYYIPPDDVTAALTPAAGASYCEWKGSATYWSVDVDGQLFDRVAWSYPTPTKAFFPLKDHVAFYVSKVDAAWVDDEQATAQPGDFYGGWVTSNLEGIVKGAPGTRHW